MLEITEGPGNRATDLSSVQECPLQSLWLDYQPALRALVCSFPGLKVIPDNHVAEFGNVTTRQQ
jgi:hypothetical protein